MPFDRSSAIRSRSKATQPWARLLLGIFAVGAVLTIISCADEQSPPAAAGPSPNTTPPFAGGDALPGGELTPTPAPAPTAAPDPRGVRGPRGGPGPRPFEITAWSSDRDSYLPGEPISVHFVLRSIWDKAMTVKALPEKVALHTDSAREEIPLAQGIEGTIPEEIQPGQEIELSIEIPASLSATLVPGRYSMQIQGQFTHVDASEFGGTLGWGSGLLFVVQPPQGAMDGSVAIGEARDDQGIRIILESIEFTPAKTTIVALAVPRDYKPTAGLGPGGPPHGATALHRPDEGPWQELRGLGNRETAEGVRLEWTLGPTPADATTFGFRVTSFMVNPSLTVSGLWEWSVPLQTPVTPTPPAGVITPELLPPGEPPRPTAMPAGK